MNNDAAKVTGQRKVEFQTILFEVIVVSIEIMLKRYTEFF